MLKHPNLKLIKKGSAFELLRYVSNRERCEVKNAFLPILPFVFGVWEKRSQKLFGRRLPYMIETIRGSSWCSLYEVVLYATAYLPTNEMKQIFYDET